MSPRKSNYDHLAEHEWILSQTHDLEHKADDWQEGFPASTGGGPTSKGGHSDRVSTEAVRGMVDHVEDPITRQLVSTTIAAREGHGLADEATALLDELRQMHRTQHNLAIRIRRLQGMGQQAAATRTRPDQQTPGAGWCNVDACETYCSGAKNDCIVTGMCPSCSRAWRRKREADPDASLTVFRTTYQPRNVQRTSDGDETAACHQQGA